jgi:hypothetical protein
MTARRPKKSRQKPDVKSVEAAQPTKRPKPPNGMVAAEIQPELIGVGEAQILSGVSKWTWRSYAYQRLIESVKIGNRLLVPISEVRRMIREGTRPRRDGLPAGAPSKGDRAAIVRMDEVGESTNA